nr:MAG TPA_asm: hypothetical protein [Caudoviricetes sp.]
MTIVYYYLRGNFCESVANLQSGRDKIRRTCIYLQT